MFFTKNELDEELAKHGIQLKTNNSGIEFHKQDTYVSMLFSALPITLEGAVDYVLSLFSTLPTQDKE